MDIITVTAPTPGLVEHVSARAGDVVQRGDALARLYFVKMEIVIPTPRDGVVIERLVDAGERVAAGQALVRLRATPR